MSKGGKHCLRNRKKTKQKKLSKQQKHQLACSSKSMLSLVTEFLLVSEARSGQGHQSNLKSVAMETKKNKKFEKSVDSKG